MPSIHKPVRAQHRLTVTPSGDSYSSTDFDPKKEQPSPSNPFGNPALPDSSSINLKWIQYLTTTYNDSLIQTYNMASYGATMDGFVRFYHEHFMPHYGISNHTGAAGWNSTNSLFAIFFGINDVRRCTDQPLTKDDCSEIYESLFLIYRFMLEQVSILFYFSISHFPFPIFTANLLPSPQSSTQMAPATSSYSTSHHWTACPSLANGATPYQPSPSHPGTLASSPSPLTSISRTQAPQSSTSTRTPSSTR